MPFSTLTVTKVLAFIPAFWLLEHFSIIAFVLRTIFRHSCQYIHSSKVGGWSQLTHLFLSIWVMSVVQWCIRSASFMNYSKLLSKEAKWLQSIWEVSDQVLVHLSLVFCHVQKYYLIFCLLLYAISKTIPQTCDAVQLYFGIILGLLICTCIPFLLRLLSLKVFFFFAQI